MLLKVFIGIGFYNKNTLSSIRSYLIARYFYNIVVICPTYVLLRFYTSAFLPNYFYTGGILCGIEILIAALYAPNLFERHDIETIEDIPGFKIIHSADLQSDARFTSSNKHRGKSKIVVNMNVREAARHLVNEIGEETSKEIVEKMQERYLVAKKKMVKMRSENQYYNNGGGYMCDFEFLSSEDEENGKGGHAEVKRP
jgi:hypothetical protein